ncbi:MAG TPA: Hsp20/alpha crystallin family protein [Candidatus Saccharibacteria bacterium]|nr:Hsp20/alpha crystallin family protein [Candidatus Saccharibacteria bacterium]HMT39943.1 Hsp20/alpha crystallin family protein [Candidatus Saccharibacteria bacterium]
MANIIKYDPFAELNALQKQFFGDDWFTPVKSMNIPTTDVYTVDDKEMVVEAHLPKFDQKDIDIHVEDGSLVIQAEKRETEKDKSKKYVVRESSSSFYRRINLPQLADEKNIAAEMSSGVLKVSVPLKSLPAPKKIAIKPGK